ncbi:MAG TPA: hypothetical protein VGG28_10470 [Kofleriaceae bacterium]|jgi:hypothetical protein
MAWRVLVVPAVAFVAACSPFGNGAFACTEDSQCGAGGTCSSGYCAFADSSCASGERYGSLSGPSSGNCVGATTSQDAPMTTDGNGPDAFMFEDARVPMDGTYCYGTGLAVACFAAPPATPVTLTAAIDTGGAMCATNVIDNPPWCVIAGSEVTVTGTVVATGAKPLVLVAVDKVDVQGALSVASTRGAAEVIGASADYAQCDPGTLPTAGKGGGGAGGSFGGNGGDGGTGTNNAGAGTHGAMQTAMAMRGGCPGQDGDGNGGAPGHGGGAIALVAGATVSVEGSVNASGEGGAGGQHPSGGGGGAGAGGLIVLDAPTVTATGSIFTNGGGGGEASGVTGNDGDNGNDPTVAGAAATTGGSSGGQGGAGGVGTTAAAPGGSVANHAGGGGGASVGVIKLYQATSIGGGGTVSPPHD